MITLDPKHYKIAWIAPLEIEAKAAMCLLDEEHHGRFPVSRGDDYVFQAGAMGGHNIIIATLPAGHKNDTGSAAALASQVKKFFPNLWFGLLVGVAAGLPNLSSVPVRDIRLGDVLVSLAVGDSAGLVPYDLGKEMEDGFQTLGHSLAMTETIVLSAIGSIKLRAPNETNLFLPYYEKISDCEHATGTFADPGQGNDILFDDNGDDKIVERPQRSKSNHQRARVWYGPIGSGEKLVKSAKKRDELRDRYGIIGLEKSAAGIMNRIPVGIIRGVCDYGDRHNNKSWQPYAAAMAASYARALLDEVPPIEKTPDTGYQSIIRRIVANDALKKAHTPPYYTPVTKNTPITGRSNTEKRPEYSIFWVPILSDKTAERAYADIAKKVRLRRINKVGNVKDLVYQHLSSGKTSKWLLVVDNADD
ncbi:hypothetical protein ACHAP4_010861 [Fusarium culmorum]